MTVKDASETIIDINWCCDALEEIYNGNNNPELRIAFKDAVNYLNAYKNLIKTALDKTEIML